MADFTPPMNYSGAFSDTPSPVAAFTQGLQSGAGLQQVQMQQTMQQAQLARMQQMQQASAQVAQNPTPQAIAQLSIAFPEMSENFKRSYDMLQPAQQQSTVNRMTPILAAALNGRGDIAAGLLREDAQAARNSGDEQRAQHAEVQAQWAEQHPASFAANLGLQLAGVMGPDKFGQTFKDIGDEQRKQGMFPIEQQKAQAEADTATAKAAYAPQQAAADLANTNSQITTRAGQLQLDRDKLMSDTQTKLYELDKLYGTPAPEMQKQISEWVIEGSSKEQSAARLNDLASRIESDNHAFGGAGSIADLYKNASNGWWGSGQDGVSALKQEIARQLNNTAIASLKDQLGGGKFTDTDMKAALGNVPNANSNPSLISSYFRGMAKLQQISAAQQNAQAEWASQNRHLGNATKDLMVMGTQVPKGTTFADFSRQFIQDKAQQIAAQSALAKHPNLLKYLGNGSAQAPAGVAGAPDATAGGTPGSTGGATGSW